ncbi:MAG: transglutaminase-like domain-containing protein [Candidatus Melainabacteria bacterium]|nr:transglutaminase-like domain-containing protein [Candidatus Melainabacteria bacterium]
MNRPPSDPNANKNAGKMKAPPKPEEPKEPAEDSVPLRIIVFLMAIVCVGASCILSHSSWMLTGLYLLLVASGSFLSYQHRHDELKWLHWLALAGILFVGAGVLKEFLNPLRDEFDFVSPFIHFLAGVFAFITFEMRTRSDLNLSSTMGLLLLLLIAPVEKGLPLLAVILVYIILGSFMLYFDCLSETLKERLQKPIAKAPEVKPAGVAIRRRSSGYTIPALMLIPLLSVVVFIFSPRSDDFLDRIMAAAKSFDPGILVSNIAPPPPPAQRKLTPEEEERSRAWFQQRHGISKIDPKDKNFKKRNASEDVDYVPPPPTKKGTQAKPHTEDPKKAKKGKEQQSESEATPPPEKDKQNKNKNKEKNKGKGSAGADQNKSESSASDKPGSPSGKGKNKRQRGKASSSDSKSGNGSGNGNNGGGDFEMDDDLNLSMADKLNDRNQIILIAKTRRIVYFRRRCYDVYTGFDWHQRDESKVEPVKVTNGEIKKEFKVNYAPPAASIPRYTPPPQNLLAPGQSVNGGASGSVSITGPGRSSGNDSQTNSNSNSSSNSSSQDSVENSAHLRPFRFQDQDKPLYRVSMADALKLPGNFPSIELMQEMKVKAKSIGKYVPGAWIPQEVRLFNTTVTVDSMGAVAASKNIERNTEFKVKTQLPMYDLNAMRLVDPLSYQEEENMRDEFAAYLDLPKTLPQTVFELAETKTNPQYNWFVQCEQIAEYLRKNFKYNAIRDVDEEADDYVAEFLFKRKEGHCTDFASAFVVMARCVGIPARLVTGFGPGTLNNMTGEREIKASDLYTWAEAYIPQSGWVPFDPTPQGFMPDVKKNDETTIDQVKEKLGLDKEDQEEKLKDLAAKAVDIIFWGLGILILLVVLALCLRFLIPMLRNLKKSPYKRGAEWAILLKVQKTLEKKLKQPRLPTETPLDFIERLRSNIVKTKNTKHPIPRDLPETLNRFYKAYSEVYFGQRKEKLEDVKEYGKQVIGVVSGKAPAEKKTTPPRGKRKGTESEE